MCSQIDRQDRTFTASNQSLIYQTYDQAISIGIDYQNIVSAYLYFYLSYRDKAKAWIRNLIQEDSLFAVCGYNGNSPVWTARGGCSSVDLYVIFVHMQLDYTTDIRQISSQS
jgi:hypothetical protein